MTDTPDTRAVTPEEPTLRDLFAMQAMNALVGVPGSVPQPLKTAVLAYAYANAMMVVRAAP